MVFVRCLGLFSSVNVRNRWVDQTLVSVGYQHIVAYPTPVSLSYGWSLGSIAGMMLVGQILTGVMLAMHYSTIAEEAFRSVEHIVRDVQGGYILRGVHANGASMFFLAVYIHMGRGIYYGSFLSPRGLLWVSGVVIFLLMIITGFMGYVLPWGQMSLWGATVITNLVSAIPFVGSHIVTWLWGGYSIGSATLNRFFALHYLLPFVIVGLVLVHLALLHSVGSGNRLGTDSSLDMFWFYPYCYVKDLFVFLVYMFSFSLVVWFRGDMLGHPVNFIEANSLKTPTHIVPEWYLLPFYAILRAIPHKVGGVIAMLGSILGLLFLPVLGFSEVRGGVFGIWHRIFSLFFIGIVLLLGWLGGQRIEEPYIILGQFLTVLYFIVLFLGIPFSGWLGSFCVRR